MRLKQHVQPLSLCCVTLFYNGQNGCGSAAQEGATTTEYHGKKAGGCGAVPSLSGREVGLVGYTLSR